MKMKQAAVNLVACLLTGTACAVIAGAVAWQFAAVCEGLADAAPSLGPVAVPFLRDALGRPQLAIGTSMRRLRIKGALGGFLAQTLRNSRGNDCAILTFGKVCESSNKNRPMLILR
jgi:hypothetical protein